MNYEKILEKIKPRPEEIQKMNQIARMLINEINKEGYEAVLVGSSARNDYVRGTNDIDIFVYFPKNVKREKFEELGLNLGKKVLAKYKPAIHYAEHPYVKGIVEGMNVEIVPCYKIEKGEKIISAVDRSPLHNEFFGKKIKGLEDEILLLKQFMKANGCYGANERIQGFSGALCEFLIINYKNFEKTIEAAANEWGMRVLINGKKTDEKRFHEDQLIVIDPVDSDRNMAAAVSRKTLSRFIFKARQYLKNPSEEFFFLPPRNVDFSEMTNLRRIVMLEFQYPANIIAEIVWSQLRKLSKSIKMKLEEEGFVILNDFVWTDEERECAILFEIESHTLNPYKKRKGPEIFEKEHAEKFIEKHKKVWIERNRLYAWQRRPHTRIVDFLRDILIKEPMPSHLSDLVKRGKILQVRELNRYKHILQKYEEELIV